MSAQRVVVYLPVGLLIGDLAGINDRSAIVGQAGAKPGTLIIYYADERSAGTARYADRVNLAAGRMLERYPTVACRQVPHQTLRPIGEFDIREGEIVLLGDEERRGLAAFLKLAPQALDDELHASGARFEQRRQLRRALADPRADCTELRQLARRWGHEDLLDEPPERPGP